MKLWKIKHLPHDGSAVNNIRYLYYLFCTTTFTSDAYYHDSKTVQLDNLFTNVYSRVI